MRTRFSAHTGRRIRINRPDDENARCKVSRTSGQRRDFSPFMQPPTTPSTFNAISFQQGRTEHFEPQPWTRGARQLPQHEQDRQRDRSRLSFDNVTMPSLVYGKFFAASGTRLAVEKIDPSARQSQWSRIAFCLSIKGVAFMPRNRIYKRKLPKNIYRGIFPGDLHSASRSGQRKPKAGRAAGN